ncbi:MAG TPA: hypothetical protein VFC83_01130 [Erysipelotrichaceae bacterium]|nr:hypothetical protein [Erysipelotrichaceae bacterium]
MANKETAPKVVVEEKAVVEEVAVEEEAEEALDLDSYGSTWVEVVESIIEKHVADEFTMDDVLAHQEIAAKIYPKNNSVEATIKRNVAALVKDEKLIEVSEDNFKKNN